MKVTINKPISVDVKSLRLNVHVRYPNDGSIISSTGEFKWDDMHNPKMPLLYNVNNEWYWRPTIDIETGKIHDWPNIKARISYKVCDEFECDIIDKDEKLVQCYDGYVPLFFGVIEPNYGDYIFMDINEDGFIEDWKCNEKDIETLIRN